MPLRLSYVARRDDTWAYGRTWLLYALEDGELEFITDWMQQVEYANQKLSRRG